jgi:hypothetical protein
MWLRHRWWFPFAAIFAMGFLAVASHADELTDAYMACHARFSSPVVWCNAMVGGSCQYHFSLPACDVIEQRWNAPGGPAAQATLRWNEGEAADRELVEKVAKP